MGVISIIFGIILLLFAFLLLSNRKEEIKILGFLLMLSGVIFLVAGIGVEYDKTIPKEPTALDVYRGKTTLQITYQDSIPIDSVVVFKNK